MFELAEMAGRADVTQFANELPASDVLKWCQYYREQQRTGQIRTPEQMKAFIDSVKGNGST